MNWIPANIELPKQTQKETSDKVLVLKTDIHGNVDYDILRYNHVQGFWETQTGTCKISHWQSLPRKPKT